MSQLTLAPQLSATRLNNPSANGTSALANQANNHYEEPPTELSAQDHFGSQPSGLKQAPQVQSGMPCCIPFLAPVVLGIGGAIGAVVHFCAVACACCCGVLGIPVAGLAAFNYFKK
jgi:hypothetical protein